ncbi:hypothetical protein RZS08_18675, partial [Arthrospira platensis SPKY1]|nr:hypothetical protein [Arthrospira platensis SPKY1]
MPDSSISLDDGLFSEEREKTTAIHFRRRYPNQSKRLSPIKVFSTQRVPGKKHPEQWHLGYISAPVGPCADKLLDETRFDRKFKAKWRAVFGDDKPCREIDWIMVRRKYTKLKAY